MATRVLSTAEAHTAIGAMQAVLNGPLIEQIKAINDQGTILSDPSIWDGQLAEQFRSEWPNTKSSLDRAKEAVETLRVEASRINGNIMTAGGNS